MKDSRGRKENALTPQQWKEKMRKRKQRGKPAKKKPVRKKEKSFNDEQYSDPEWQDLRERIIQRDNNRCVGCGAKTDNLHVHHLLYENNKKIWEVPDWYLVTLCRKCHFKEHKRRLTAPRMI